MPVRGAPSGGAFFAFRGKFSSLGVDKHLGGVFNKHVTTTQNPTRHIQAIGNAPAKLAEEITTDDTLLYNFGTTARVTLVEQVSPKFFAITVATKDGEYTRRYKIGTLVAVTRY